MTYSCAIFEDLDSDINDEVALRKRQDTQKSKLTESLPAGKLNGYCGNVNDHVHVNINIRLANGNGTSNGNINRNSTASCHPNDNVIANGNSNINGYPKVNGRAESNGYNFTHDHPTNDGDAEQMGPKDELYEAQMRKLDHIIKKAKIQPGHRVLEIGSGWGSMAIRITNSIPGTTVDTLTLSVEQQQLAQKRIAAAGLSDRVTVHLMDYRNMPPHWEGVFDRLISVEMLEAVGEKFMETYWKIVDWALKPRIGAGVVQVITIPESSAVTFPGT